MHFVEVDITGENKAFYGFGDGDRCGLLSISFDAGKAAANTSAEVELLEGPSANVPVLPPGRVYRHLNIRVGSYEFGKSGVGGAAVRFRVEKAWVNEIGVNVSTIRLCRFDSGVWGRLPVEIVDGPDPVFYYFEAITPGFSPFAIASPLIKTANPGEAPVSEVGMVQKFGIEANRACNLTWYINGTVVQRDNNTTSAQYINRSVHAGVYNVTVVARSGAETGVEDDRWAWAWTVKPASASSSKSRGGSGGGGSGGGGGGGSPEPASNVEIKELAQAFVMNGGHVRFNFVRNVTCVNYVEFDSRKTAGKVTAIVEALKGQSKLVSELPPARVYKNINIWVGNAGFAAPGNLENSLVGFRVEKTWMKEKGIDAPSICLWRYEDNEWKQLDTLKVGEDERFVFFESETPGFSSFTVTGGALAVSGEDSKQSVENGEQNVPDKNATKTDDLENGLPGFGLIAAVFGVLLSVVTGMRNRRK